MYTADEYKDVIALLLTIVDRYEPSIHLYGNTPDWYVTAAQMSCGIDVPNVVETLERYRNEYFGPNKE